MLEFDYPTVMKKLSHCAISHQCQKNSIMQMTTFKANVRQATKLKFKTDQKKIHHLRFPLKINRIIITYELKEKISKMNLNYADVFAIGGHRIA